MAETPSSADPSALQSALQEAQQQIAVLQTKLDEKTADLAEADKNMLTLIYTVSHDLRSPLNIIDGFNQLLQRSLNEHASEKTLHYAQRIRAGVQQMAELIDALLALSRASHNAMESQSVDLSALAQAALVAHTQREPERQVQITIQPGMTVQADAKLLTLALKHLLDNAWKFSSAKPATQISFTSHLDAQGETVYAVKDQGAGFDPTRADKLFSTFQRMHSPEEFPGVGIGLAIAKKITMRHGGQMWADATPDQGATFYFTLPQRAKSDA